MERKLPNSLQYLGLCLRIASVNCGNSTWAQSFSYDAFGNISKTVPSGATGASYTAGYSTVTNQVSSLLSPLPTYDANGNQLTSTPANLTWNALNQPITVNSTGATYDALGRMVEKGSGGTYTQFVFRPSGAILAVYSGGLTKGTIPLPGGSTAIYNSNGLNFIRHTDWLGSSRLATTWAHAVYSKEAYAPFGETYNEAGTSPDRSFTGQDQDVATGTGGAGVYDFLFRKYDPSAGRWLSPDPLGWGAVDQTTPQSLNRYAYVQNDPLRFVDANGMNICYYGDPNDISVDSDPSDWGSGSPQDCAAENGQSVNAIESVTVNANDPNSCKGDNPNSVACMRANITTFFVLVPSASNYAAPNSGGGGGGAPNNGTSKQQQCALQTLKKNGVSLALDAAGFIPGESQVMAGVQLGVSAASFTNSLMTASDNPNGAAIGATSSIVGAQITGVGMAAKSMGVSWAKAVPWIGYGVNALATLNDLSSAYGDYQSCMSHP
jgi:RHS repeat-associated protein